MNEQPASTGTEPVRTLAPVRATANIVLVVGILELVYSVYWSGPNQIQLQFMLLLVGSLLYFGSDKVIAVVRWLALLAAIPAIIAPFQQLAVTPLGLTITQLRVHPGAIAQYYLPLFIMAATIVLIARRLHRPDVSAVLRSRGMSTGGVALPVGLGLLFMVISATIMIRLLHGEDAERAAQLAAQRFGPHYQYFTNRLHIFKSKETTVTATVQMWNDKGSWEVPVRWRR